MSDDSTLDEFCDALWLEDGLSRNTLTSYRLDLEQFAGWLDKRSGKSLRAADHGDLLAYLAHRRQVQGDQHEPASVEPQALLSIRTAPGQDQG